MKIEIVSRDSVPVRQVRLSPGWSITNESGKYLDLVKVLFKQDRPDRETIYYTQRVTFVANDYDEDWEDVYSVFEQSNPSGLHEMSQSFRLTVEAAMALVFEEI